MIFAVLLLLVVSAAVEAQIITRPPICVAPKCTTILPTCRLGTTLKTVEKNDANGCPLCPEYSCVAGTTCQPPICLQARPICASNAYLQTTVPVDGNGCRGCPRYSCQTCPECPLTVAMCSAGWKSAVVNVTDENGCTCRRNTCVPDTCDSAGMILPCPLPVDRVCPAGSTLVSKRLTPCSCVTRECQACPAPVCPAVLCPVGSESIQQFGADGCPTCPICKSACLPLGCPAPQLCRSGLIGKVTSPQIGRDGCPIDCGTTTCCPPPPPCGANPELQCGPGEEARTTNNEDASGCFLCPKVECVKKGCEEPICALGFRACLAPLVHKSIPKTDPVTGCALCPENVCVQPDQCSDEPICPVVRPPVCPAGSSAVLVKTAAERCSGECPRFECQKDQVTCPRIACLAPEAQQRCPPGQTLQEIATELENGCPGCPTTQCVETKCDSLALVCPLGFPRCRDDEVAETTVDVDENGCKRCPVVRCVKKKPDVCPLPACREIAIKCARGFVAKEFKQTTADGCDLCPEKVCVPVDCAELKCALPDVRCSGRSVVSTVFDARGCPSCPREECRDFVCPRLECPDVLPQCGEGEVVKEVPQAELMPESDRSSGDAAAAVRCPQCPVYQCVKSTSCRTQACPALRCAAGERPNTLRDANGCARGCPACVPICSAECDLATRGENRCASGAEASRAVDNNGCCKWSCVNDDKIVIDVPPGPPKPSAAANLMLAASLAIVALVTAAL